MTQWWRKIVAFIREVVAETKKTTWPTRREAVASTIVVLIAVVLTAFYLGIIDFVLSAAVRWLVG
jgi:preprotein translocase subunit SecE